MGNEFVRRPAPCPEAYGRMNHRGNDVYDMSACMGFVSSNSIVIYDIKKN